MSKWKDTAPTKILGGGKKTKKISGVINEPPAQSKPETVSLRQEEGVMGGVNLQLPKDQDETRPIKPNPESTPTLKAGAKTQFFRPRKNKSTADNTQQTATVNQGEVVEKPVTGWVVIIKGKGKGQAIPLSYGLLRMGRDAGQGIPLDYGDEGISRENHASIEFDKKTRKFYLAKGENLVYLNGDERVGQGAERELSSGDEISFGGETVLRFIAFCGPDFDWHED